MDRRSGVTLRTPVLRSQASSLLSTTLCFHGENWRLQRHLHRFMKHASLRSFIIRTKNGPSGTVPDKKGLFSDPRDVDNLAFKRLAGSKGTRRWSSSIVMSRLKFQAPFLFCCSIMLRNSANSLPETNKVVLGVPVPSVFEALNSHWASFSKDLSVRVWSVLTKNNCEFRLGRCNKMGAKTEVYKRKTTFSFQTTSFLQHKV